MVDAFARLADRFSDWRLRIVGEGELREMLEAQVRELGLHIRIDLSGAIVGMDEGYRWAAIFAMPSLYESFGIATAEALAAGVPAIGFADCPGTNELIHDGINGILVSGADRTEALAQGLTRLMESQELRETLSRASPRSVEGFTISNVADQWEELLQSTLGR